MSSTHSPCMPIPELILPLPRKMNVKDFEKLGRPWFKLFCDGVEMRRMFEYDIDEGDVLVFYVDSHGKGVIGEDGNFLLLRYEGTITVDQRRP